MKERVYTFHVELEGIRLACTGRYYKGYRGWQGPPEPETFEFHDVTLNGADVWPLLGEEQRYQLESLCIERIHEMDERAKERDE